MKRYKTGFFLALSFFLVANCVYAQYIIPILETAWPLELKTDKEKIKIYLGSYPDSASYYINKLESKSRQIDFIEGLVHAQIYKGKISANAGAHDRALMHYHQGLDLCIKRSAIQAEIPILYGSIGNCHVQRGAYHRANQYYHKALSYITRFRPYDPNLPLVYLGLSAVNSRINQYKEALFYAAQAEALMSANGNDSGAWATLYSAIASAYAGLDKNDTAEILLHKSLLLAGKHHALHTRQNVLTNLGVLQNKKKKFLEAIAYFNAAKQLGSNTDPYYSFILPGYGLGQAYYNLGKYEKAQSVLWQAIDSAQKIGLSDQRIYAHTLLRDIYTKTGSHAKAFKQQKCIMALKDSLVNKEKINAINEMTIKYATAQKDKNLAGIHLKISQQKKKLHQKNYWFLATSSGILVLTFLLFYINKASRQRRIIKDKRIHILRQQQVLLQKEKEIKQLNDFIRGEENERIRIARDLHDGIVSQLMGVRFHFNSALQKTGPQLMHPPDFDTILLSLDSATAELRRIAHNLMPETVLQTGLLVALYTYCAQMAESSSVSVHFQYYGDYQRNDPDTELSLYRIIQELVQNALKHAEARSILVELSQDDELLYLMVEDDGRGFPDTNPETKAGRGLKSISSRIKTLDASMQISSTPGVGTTVQIEWAAHSPHKENANEYTDYNYR